MTRFSGSIGEEYRLFKLASPHYDDIENIAGSTVAAAFPRTSEARFVLELGCGTGYTTHAILSRHPDIAIVAIDNEPKMIRQANEALEDYLQGRLLLVEADALEYLTGCKSDVFDGFASGFMLHNLQDSLREKIIGQVARVLKPGAIFVNGDKYARDDLAKHQKDLEWQLEQLAVFDSIGRPDLKKEWTDHYLFDDQPGIRMHETEFAGVLEQNGFSEIEMVYRNHMDGVMKARRN